MPKFSGPSKFKTNSIRTNNEQNKKNVILQRLVKGLNTVGDIDTALTAGGMAGGLAVGGHLGTGIAGVGAVAAGISKFPKEKILSDAIIKRLNKLNNKRIEKSNGNEAGMIPMDKYKNLPINSILTKDQRKDKKFVDETWGKLDALARKGEEPEFIQETREQFLARTDPQYKLKQVQKPLVEFVPSKKDFNYNYNPTGKQYSKNLLPAKKTTVTRNNREIPPEANAVLDHLAGLGTTGEKKFWYETTWRNLQKKYSGDPAGLKSAKSKLDSLYVAHLSEVGKKLHIPHDTDTFENLSKPIDKAKHTDELNKFNETHKKNQAIRFYHSDEYKQGVANGTIKPANERVVELQNKIKNMNDFSANVRNILLPNKQIESILPNNIATEVKRVKVNGRTKDKQFVIGGKESDISAKIKTDKQVQNEKNKIKKSRDELAAELYAAEEMKKMQASEILASVKKRLADKKAKEERPFVERKKNNGIQTGTILKYTPASRKVENGPVLRYNIKDGQNKQRTVLSGEKFNTWKANQDVQDLMKKLFELKIKHREKLKKGEMSNG